MSPSKFRSVVNDEKKLLTDLCEKWENVLTISEQGNDDSKAQDEGPPSSRTRSKAKASGGEEAADDSETAAASAVIPDEEMIGLVRATTGQGRMLLGQRFVQFEKLIDDAENKTSEKPIGDDDLQGFWDMIGFQVDDMKERFQVLEQAQANDWKLPETKKEEAPPKPAPSSKPKQPKPATSGKKKPTAAGGGSSGVRDFIAQKRREAALAKKKKQQEEEEEAGKCGLCSK